MQVSEVVPVVLFLASGLCIYELNRLSEEILQAVWRADPSAMKDRPPGMWTSGETLMFTLSLKVPEDYPAKVKRLHRYAKRYFILLIAMLSGAVYFWIGRALWMAFTGGAR